ncbi:MAG: YaiO family outer membrane beta-barrel protein [Terriglobales bacterium]
MTIANLGQNRLKTLLLLASIGFALHSKAQSPPTSVESDQAPVPAVVTAQPEAQTKPLTNYVETGADYMTLTNGFGSWSGGYTRGVYEQGKSIWNAEITGQREFGDAGVYFDAGDTYNFNPDWYGALTIGSSAGGFFWPRFRTDAFMNKKWLGRKQWITTAGISYDMAKDVHRDHTFYLGTTYYFEKPWIVEEGLYFNISHPGAVFAPAGFVAVTQGHNKQQYITVRAGFGEEAYQLIGPTATLSQFNSETLTITWRKWMGPDWGFNFVGDYYHSPFYLRGGSTFGFFKEF